MIENVLAPVIVLWATGCLLACAVDCVARTFVRWRLTTWFLVVGLQCLRNSWRREG
jgi:hypothetical protein